VTVDGAELLRRIRASAAKATIVNAWASWCGPCRREIPMLEAMAENLRQQGVEFVLVSVDEPEERAQAEAFLRDHHVTLKSYMAARPLEPFKLALNPRWPGMLPATFLYDGAGKLRYYWGGPAYEQEILPIIEGFLAGKTIDGEATFGLAPGRVER
jgi:thiol-disulfide isomerase/thioredoxin